MENFSKVNFLVGVNGSGKSQVLNSIGQEYLRENTNVLAISNTVFDKFSQKIYKKLSARAGKNFLKNTIVDSFLNENNSIYNILEYLGYEKEVDALISFHSDFDGDFLSYFIREIHRYNKFDVSDDGIYIDYELNELEGFCKKLEKLLYAYNDCEYIFNFGNWENRENIYNLSIFKRLCDLFINKKIIKINFVLYKDGSKFKLDGASSGESHFLAQMLFLSDNLSKDKKNIILIDEPEISLHPKWQREYVFKLYDYFYMYDLKIFIATHSPLLISKLKINKSGLYDDYIENISYRIFNVKDQKINVIDEDGDCSIESLYWEIFRILTPQSAFLSRYLVELMTEMDNIKIDGISKKSDRYKIIIDELYELQEASFSENQIKVIDKIIKEYK